MTRSAHVLFWITLCGMLLLGTPLLSSPEKQVKRIEDEISLMRPVFGNAKVDDIVANASAIYRSLFIDTGILTEESKVYTAPARPEQEQIETLARPASAMSRLTNGYLSGFAINLFGVFVRGGMAMHWLVFILPFLAATFIDGFVTRKIKFAEFGFISPMSYTIGLHAIIAILFVPFVYAVAPLPITPYFMPGWALCLGLPIMMMISNTQRLFGN